MRAEAAWEAGRAMPLEKAIRYAVEEAPPESASAGEVPRDALEGTKEGAFRLSGGF